MQPGQGGHAGPHRPKKPLDEGVQIAAAHIDSPRLDLKPNPLYEESELAYFKTHYYGGIRKYQWVTIPLELHGVVAMKDGTTVEVNIGADAGDPMLVITDLLPHLGMEQGKKPLGEAIPGETLNLLVGSRPIGDEEDTNRVKLAVMQLLHEKYGIWRTTSPPPSWRPCPRRTPATSVWTAA
ncbi:MAG: hypothetical protein V8R40_06765 [Dysosmobacter sp.]